MRLKKRFASDHKSKHQEFIEKLQELEAGERALSVAKQNISTFTDEEYDIMINGIQDFKNAKDRNIMGEELYQLTLAKDSDQLKACFDAYISYNFTPTKINLMFQQALNNLYLKNIRRPICTEDLYEVMEDWKGKW